MVVKMMKWSPWPTMAAKKFHVQAKEIKLVGFFSDHGTDDDCTEKVMAVEMKWKGGPKPGLVPFHRPSSKQRRKHISSQITVKNGESIDWDDEFDNTCSFPIAAKDNAFAPWAVSFTLLYGAKTESNKLGVVGKASMNLGEMASKMESRIEAKVPVNFNVAGVTGEATLSVCFSFAEIRDSQDSLGIVQNSTESKNVDCAKGDGIAYDEEKLKSQEEVSADDSDESAMCDSEVTSENESVSMSNSVDMTTLIESGSGPSSETQSDSVKKPGFFSWKRRRLSFKPAKTKVELLIQKTSNDDDDVDSDNPNVRPVREETSFPGNWEEKELISRDGETKLKANVFFASFDQRSDKAAGESACTALVAVIAHWLHSNQDEMPTISEFDQLVIEGSSEWRNLCGKKDLINLYPNKHFDLETVMHAGLRPVSVLPEKSFVGFFGPEKFESLKGAMSFDQIWDEIKSGNEDTRPRVYIVSWNDHFFVLKVDSDAYYIIDTLGERLHEGCDRAYILRFDDSTVMKGKVESEIVGSPKPTTSEVKGKVESETVGSSEPTNSEVKGKVESEIVGCSEPTISEEVSEAEICRGKECCREFIKRFFAAIPLRELESEEEKKPVSYFSLHQRLQIEFNFSSSLSSSVSSLATSSVSSLFSEESVDF